MAKESRDKKIEAGKREKELEAGRLEASLRLREAGVSSQSAPQVIDFQKRLFASSQRTNDEVNRRRKREISIDRIEFGMASPQQIRGWAERRISTGAVVGRVDNPDTVTYRTHRPIRDGLFCERIFGPVDQRSCACRDKKSREEKKALEEKEAGGVTLLLFKQGSLVVKVRRTDDRRVMIDLHRRQLKELPYACPKCEVELVSPSVRRVRLGFIQLFSGVLNLWYWQGRTNHIIDLLFYYSEKGDKQKKWLKRLLNCETFLLESEMAPDTAGWPRQSTSRAEGQPWLNQSRLFREQHPNGSPPMRVSRRSVSPASRRYNRSHTFPFQPLFTCLPIDREVIFAYLGKAATSEDRPLLDHCNIERPPLQTSFWDPVAINPMYPNRAGQRVLCHTGGEAVGHLLRKLNLASLKENLKYQWKQLAKESDDLEHRFKALTELKRRLLLLKGKKRRPGVNLKELQKYKRSLETEKKRLEEEQRLANRRIRLVERFMHIGRRPEWMVLSNLPVLPPDLRPIIRTPEGVIVTSDLNQLYRKIIFANRGLHRMSIFTLDTLCLAMRSLQEAVHSLIDNGKGGSKPVLDYTTGQPLKSLAASLKGKTGRFRQHLLGKRVDYSGRSVIIVGPTLNLHECGLPREMAIELFHPFLIRHLQLQNVATTVWSAKRYIQQHPFQMWETLAQVMRAHPVLLNRAPTLHRLGIQAFQPRLVQGRAIHLHPLVCTGFNADFDGDQMGVHLPLSFQARAEAWRLLLSTNHILAPATGHPMLVPSQDMVLGCYYLTSFEDKMAFRGAGQRRPHFANPREALAAHAAGHLSVHALLWVRFAGRFESHTNSEEPLELRIHSNGTQLSIRSEVQRITSSDGTESRLVGRYICTTVGRLVMHDITVPVREFEVTPWLYTTGFRPAGLDGLAGLAGLAGVADKASGAGSVAAPPSAGGAAE